MRAWQVSAFGIDSLEFVERPTPAPGPGEVVAIGADVTLWKPGDRVAGIFMQNWLDGPLTAAKGRGALGGDVDGMLTDFIVLKRRGVCAIPDHLSFQEAATLPGSAGRPWNALAAGEPTPGPRSLFTGRAAR